MVTSLSLLSFFFLLSLTSYVYAYDVLYNFSRDSTTDSFYEVSDTVRSVGLSKGIITIKESEAERNAVFFSLLVPQPDGACFAGVQTLLNSSQNNWSKYEEIIVKVKSSGNYDIYKIVLQDGKSITNSSLAFEHQFTINNHSNNQYKEVSMKLRNFYCSYRGMVCDDRLDRRNLLTFGIQTAGGVSTTRRCSSNGTILDRIKLVTSLVSLHKCSSGTTGFNWNLIVKHDAVILLNPVKKIRNKSLDLI